MKITCISDTHGSHNKLKLIGGDILIHAGDITENGTEEEVIDFIQCLAKQPYEYKIFIAGNHDVFLEETPFKHIKTLLPKGVFYLQNNAITLNNIKIYDSQVTPYFLGMAFNKQRGNELKKCWNKKPTDTQILITHGPPKCKLDNGLSCNDLLEKVKKLNHSYMFLGIYMNIMEAFMMVVLYTILQHW